MSKIPESDSCGKCRQPNVRSCIECGLSSKAYEVCHSNDSGYFLKATRDLAPGEVIFSEQPLIIGPKRPEDGRVFCVGCCRIIYEEKYNQCLQCLWPICSLQCHDTRHGLECGILKFQKSFRIDILPILMTLFLQKIKKNEWDNILRRIENVETEVTQKYTFLEEEILKFEEETGWVIFEEKSATLLERISIFFQTNSLEADATKIFYSIASLLQQNCIPNTWLKTEENSSQVIVKAAHLIPTNTILTLNYTNILQGTHARLEQLRITKNISCNCDRCRDSSEFETFFSALNCLGTKEEPCGGTQLPVDPTNWETLWFCDRCGIELPNDQILEFVTHLGNEVAKILRRNSSVEDLEEFLGKLLMFLHPNHFYVFSVKKTLMEKYGNKEKIEICEDLVTIVRKFGCSFEYGQLLHELFEAFEESDRVEEVADLIEEMKKMVHFYPALKRDVEKFESY